MGEQASFSPPDINDSDIEWACDVLRLPRNAFHGSDGKDPRHEILKSTATLDIEACPGSGKTTLLVAKLAVLAKNWTESRRGICILSHTNAARREIEKQLAHCVAGQALLTYPHFVGTIHGFANEFLALPWLRSRGYPVRVIDNHLCELHRRRLLTLRQFESLAEYVRLKEATKGDVKLNIVNKWRLASSHFEVLKDNGEPEFKDSTGHAARQLRALSKKCALDGYYRYDEMFMWSHDLLKCYPEIADTIRFRFPMLFIDEVQDNNEAQSHLLFKLFMEGIRPVFRQRYGDSNQAIYQHTGEKGAKTDKFPDPAIRKDIPNSYRFGSEIATYANPLGLMPQALVGYGPSNKIIRTDTLRKHAVFLFADTSIRNVITSYASYLCETFTQCELTLGEFTVVAAVHYPGSDDKLPRSLGHYWPQYDPELASAEPKPNNLYQHLMLGRALTERSGEAHQLMERFADGILRLVRIGDPTANIGSRKRKHRYIIDFLKEQSAIKNRYLRLLSSIPMNRNAPSADEWETDWVPIAITVAQIIGGSSFAPSQCNEFLRWEGQDAEWNDSTSQQLDNVFRHPDIAPQVKLRVGSIHSVKGETHTATLVLESFYKKHHLATLKPWLVGEKAGKMQEGVENQSRLKQHYVALTRPTHLLCLAMREDALTVAEVAKLKDRGWRVARVRADGYDWT